MLRKAKIEDAQAIQNLICFYSEDGKMLFRSLEEIEITGGGKPTVNLYGNASQLAETNKVGTIHVSLSHEKETAIAFVISEVA